MKALFSPKTQQTLTQRHSFTSQKTWILKSHDVSYKYLCDWCLHICVTGAFTFVWLVPSHLCDWCLHIYVTGAFTFVWLVPSHLCDWCLHIYVTGAFTFVPQVNEYCVFVSESNVTCAVQLHRRSTIWQCLMQQFAISAPISVWCHSKGSIPRMRSQAMNQPQYQQVRVSVVFSRDQQTSTVADILGINSCTCQPFKTKVTTFCYIISKHSAPPKTGWCYSRRV